MIRLSPARGLAIVGLAVGSAVTLSLPLQSQPNPDVRTVQVADGATLTLLISGVAKRTGRLVIAEKPKGPVATHRIRGASRSITIDEAIQLISSSYDLHGLVDSELVVLQKRYTRSDEPVDVTMEELEQVFVDLHRLVANFDAGGNDTAYTRDKSRFTQSLSAEQLTQARSSGLSFRNLTPPQQKLWISINQRGTYGPLAHSIRLIRDLLRNRGQVTARLQAFEQSTPIRSTPSLILRFSDRKDRGALRQTNAPILRVDGSGQPLGRPSRETVTRDSRSRLSEFRTSITLTEGEKSVQQLLALVTASSGKEIRIERRLGARQLIVSGGSYTAAHLLRSIELLYGWEVRRVRSEVWAVGRPLPGVPRDPVDLHRRLNRAIPPAIHHLLRKRLPALAKWTSEYYFAIPERVQARIEQKWTPLLELPDDAQERLAIVSILHSISGDYDTSLKGGAPRYFLVAPQNGVFKIESQARSNLKIQGGDKPVFWFGVPSPDGSIHRWGWVIGSSGSDSRP